MSTEAWVGVALAAPFILWLVARLVFTAYFYTRRQHERKEG